MYCMVQINSLFKREKIYTSKQSTGIYDVTNLFANKNVDVKLDITQISDVVF